MDDLFAWAPKYKQNTCWAESELLFFSLLNTSMPWFTENKTEKPKICSSSLGLLSIEEKKKKQRNVWVNIPTRSS